MDDSDARYCEEEVRVHDYPRWLCAALAPQGARDALHALHAFHLEMRRIPALVNEPVAGLIRLQWWRDELARIAEGKIPDHPVLRGLAPGLRDGRIACGGLLSLIDATDAVMMPAETAPDIDTMVETARASSGLLAVIGVELLGVRTEPASGAASNIGTAFAIAEHLSANESSRQAARPSQDEKQVLFDRARQLINDARGQRRQVPRAALPVLALARFADLKLGGWRRPRKKGRVPATRTYRVAGPLSVAAVGLTGRY